MRVASGRDLSLSSPDRRALILIKQAQAQLLSWLGHGRLVVDGIEFVEWFRGGLRICVHGVGQFLLGQQSPSLQPPVVVDTPPLSVCLSVFLTFCSSVSQPAMGHGLLGGKFVQ